MLAVDWPRHPALTQDQRARKLSPLKLLVFVLVHVCKPLRDVYSMCPRRVRPHNQRC